MLQPAELAHAIQSGKAPVILSVALPVLYKLSDGAIRLLESHPDFPTIQVLMRERLEEAEKKRGG